MEFFVIPVLLAVAILNGMKTIYGLDEWCEARVPWFQIWTRKQFYMAVGFWIICEMILHYLLNDFFPAFRLLDLVWTYILLAMVDGKKQEVPDSVLLCFLAEQLLLGAVSTRPPELGSCFLTGAVLTVILLLLALLSKGKIGMGDAKLLGVTAMTAGWNYTIQLVCMGLAVSLFYSIWLLVFRKESMKTEIPFVPCLTVGMMIHTIYFVL